jgi:hypothetical protein
MGQSVLELCEEFSRPHGFDGKRSLDLTTSHLINEKRLADTTMNEVLRRTRPVHLDAHRWTHDGGLFINMEATALFR